MDSIRIIVLAGIVIQMFVSRSNRKLGGIIGLVVTSIILIWGMSAYGDGNTMTFFGIELSEPIFIILCLVWFGLDISQIVQKPVVRLQAQPGVPTQQPPTLPEPPQDNPSDPHGPVPPSF
jgi:hypothetical protein